MSDPERDAPGATVVIPARDAAETIAQAVRAIASQQDAQGRGVEVIVVDDGSHDDTARLASEAGARVIEAAGDGPARARNLGLAEAQADTILFCDADCEAQPGLVAALLAPFADPDVAGTKGAYLTRQRSLTARFVQQEYEERYRRMARRATIDFVDTYACAYRRDVLERVGGFDERYRLPSTEDQELSFRVVATGAKLLFVPEARVAHRHADSPWAYFRKKLKIGRFKVATLRAHPAKAVDDAHTPLTLKLQLLLAPLTLIGVLASALAWGLGVDLHWTRHLVLWGPAAAFLVSAAPLTAAALTRDPLVGLLTPSFCVLRAWALGLGVVAGLASELLGSGVLPASARAEAGAT